MWLGIVPPYLFFSLVHRITIFKNGFIREIKKLEDPYRKIVIQFNLSANDARGGAIGEESQGGPNDLRMLWKQDVQIMLVFGTREGGH